MELGFCSESGGTHGKFGPEKGVILFWSGFLWLHSEEKTMGVVKRTADDGWARVVTTGVRDKCLDSGGVCLFVFISK